MTFLQGILWISVGLVLVSLVNIGTGFLVGHWHKAAKELVNPQIKPDFDAALDDYRLQNMEEGYALRSPGSLLIFAMGGSMGNASLLIAYHAATQEDRDRSLKESKKQ